MHGVGYSAGLKGNYSSHHCTGHPD